MKDITIFINESNNNKFDLTKLYNVISKNGDSYTFKDIVNEIENNTDTLNKKKINKIFKGFEKSEFVCITIPERGEIQDIWGDTWGTESYVDVLPNYEEIGTSDDIGEINIASGIDKNNIFIAMIESVDGDYNLCCLTKK